MTPGAGRRNRLSCDRCHAQKLRCPKQPGTSVCARCAKAGARCAFSPPGTSPALIPYQSSPQLSQAPHNTVPGATGAGQVGHSLALDWSLLSASLDLDLLKAGNPGWDEGSAAPLSDQLATPDPQSRVPRETLLPQSEAQGPVAHCSAQLAGILADLDAVLDRVPSYRYFHASSASMSEFAAEFEQKHRPKNLPEALFSATQRLIDLYPTAIHLCLDIDPEPDPQCEMADCIHRLQLPSDLAAIEESLLSCRRRPAPNLSIFNLLVSCHFRLLDVLDPLLVGALACIKFSMAAPKSQEPDFWGPELRVGSFTPKPGAQSFIQASLMKHLVDTLTGKVARLREGVESAVQRNTGTDYQLLLLQCKILQERHSTRADHIKVMGAEMTKLSLFQ